MELAGDIEYKRACGLGTKFNQEKCICDKDPNYVRNNGEHLIYECTNNLHK